MANLKSALEFLSLPNACPLCIVALNPQTGQALAVNSTFESVLGPLYKFREWDFADAACADSGDVVDADDDGQKKKMNRSDFREAIDRVCAPLRDSNGDANGDAKEGSAAAAAGRIRNVEMLTLGTNAAGMPIKKYFDWTIGSVRLDDAGDDDGPASAVILYGDLVNEVESSDRARDAELIDFFQNAPIAMHWLNGEGIVLWANQTELNVLGYTPEEYIGQPIMNFCPDERELVLEIFKQLGSGNAIADVPVRFRTKDGKLVHLLIDSNVAYNPDGSFGHTRCFIRDDTARKIRDARTKLLLVENERSLRMLDSFLSRTLHHVMGPLHALRGTCEVVSDGLHLSEGGAPLDEDEREKNCELLERAAETVTTTTRMVADVSDLARFDEGATLRTTPAPVALRDVGLAAIEALRFADLRLTGGDDGISVSLDLVGGGGPGTVATDRAALSRVLSHLLENAVREVDPGGRVALRMTSARPGGGVLVEVTDNGKGLPLGTCLDQRGFGSGKDARPAPCHRYFVGKKREPSNDPDEIQKARADMEEGLRDLKQNGVGVGLPLSYHLVRMLGGDLRHDETEGTRIWFVLPGATAGDAAAGDATAKDAPAKDAPAKDDAPAALTSETILKKGSPPAQIKFTSGPASKRRRVHSDAEFGSFVSDGGSTTSGDDTATTTATVATATTATTVTTVATPVAKPAVAAEPKAEAVAKFGIKASMPFSVLIVEDTDICARLLAMQLKKLKCSTQRAENGRVAVDILKESLPGTFDMVLMDLRMPVMDGLEATRVIRDELGIVDLPVLALTGEMREDIRAECEGIGFTEFFQKPLPRKKLQELVARYKAARDGEPIEE